MKRSILFVLLLCLFSTAVFAQTAQFSGIVQDSSGATLPKATITVLSKDKGFKRTTESNTNGYYVVPLLPPGHYMVTVQANGFQTVSWDGLTLDVEQAARLDFTLKPGSIQETITVKGDVPLVQTDSASVGTVVDRQFVANMPLNGRSFQSLIELTPGVVASVANYNNQGQFNVNGQRSDTNYFTVDGVSANAGIGAGGSINTAGTGALPATASNGGFNSLASIDALEEFRIETSTFAPEYGRMPGGQVSMVTRSGTNTMHGTAFDYLRNDVFDANDWFSNHAGLPKAPLRQNDFGGVLGGPIIKDKLFFFLSYEGLRLSQPSTEVGFVPSLFARQNAAPGAQPYLNAYPLPTGPPAASDPLVAQFNAALPGTNQLDAGSVRVDYHLSQRMLLFGRYNDSPSNGVSRRASIEYPTDNLLRTFTLGHTFAISPRVSNDFRLNYTRSRASSGAHSDSFGGAVPMPESTIFPNPQFTRKGGAQSTFLPFAELDQLSDGQYGNNRNHQWNLVDTLSYTKGSHQMKFGFDYRQLTPVFIGSNWEYFLVFVDSASWFNGVADAIGLAQEPEEAYRITNYSTYFQDTWKVRPRLTLTYGVRWEVNPGVTSPNGTPPFSLRNDFDPNNAATILTAPFGTPTWKTTWTNFAPRVGVVYQLSQDPRWGRVLRGGFGVFYDTAGAAAGFVFGPLKTGKSFGATPLPPVGLDLTPQPPSLNPPYTGAPQSTDPNLKMPYVYQFNLALQQALGNDQSVSATYVGAIGRRLLRTETFFPLNAEFPCCFWMWRNTTTSDYHALQLQFQRRLSHGLQALASYTWSHSIDDCSYSTGFGQSNCEFVHLANATQTNERGPSNFDIRNSFQLALSYNVPSPGENPTVRTIFGHWSVDGILRYRSAIPNNVVAGTFLYTAGPASYGVDLRPDVVPGQPFYISDPAVPGGVKYNPAAFTDPPLDPTTGNPVRQGTLRRNALVGFPSQQIDLALRRDFRFAENYNLEFRADFFNIFNHPSFFPQVNQLTNPNFGISNSMLNNGLGSGNGSNGGNGGFNPLYQIGGPRSVQLALKFHF